MADITLDANPLGGILTAVNTILDRVLPDKAANDAAKAQLLAAQLNGQLQANLAQANIDNTEASNQRVFVAGWRPFVGWICGSALAYSYIIQPCIVAICVLAKVNFDATKLPTLNMPTLIGLLSTMMGMGILRSFDKTQGTGNGN